MDNATNDSRYETDDQDENVRDIDLNKQGSLGVTLYYIRRDISDIKKNVSGNMVTRTEFDPIKKIVYGMISVVLLTVLTAILGGVIIALNNNHSTPTITTTTNH